MFPYFLNANRDNMQKEAMIAFSKTNLTVKQALNEINSLDEVSVAYNGKETFLDYKITLPKDSINVKEALQLIESQAPVLIIFNNNHIIIKSRKLKKSYQLIGKVKDAEISEALIGATVLMPGSSQGTVTNVNGEFVLNLAPDNYQFEIRYLGYKNKKFTVNLFEDKNITVFLEATQQEIEEVKVIGNYIDVQELETGRNIERIDAKTIKQINYNNPTDALQGRINGVWSTRVSGAPGDHQKIRIRGINSLFAAVDPLYVVNGVQIPVVNLTTLGIADINSRDIESITVLKDVASTAYYGYQGGNGVVKIETKKGGGKNQISFSSRTGFQNMKKRYPLMNSKEFLQTMEKIDTVFPYHYTNYPRYYEIPQDALTLISGIRTERNVYPHYNDTIAYADTGWQDKLFQYGKVQEYQLAFQGSKKKFIYYISGNYFDHDGVVINSNYNKYSYSANLGISPFKNFNISVSGFGSIRENKNNLDNYLGNKKILQGINIEPNYNILSYEEKQRIREFYQGEDYTMNRPEEMYAFGLKDMPDLYINNLWNGSDLFYLRNQNKDITSNNVSLEFNYQIGPNLSISNRSSVSSKEYTFYSKIKPGYIDDEAKHYNSIENYKVMSNVFNGNYSKAFSGHTVILNATYRFYRDQVKWNVDSVYGFKLDEIDKTTDGYIRGSNAIYGKTGNVVREINSFIIHAKYSYKNRYTISAFANFDQMEEGNHVNAKEIFPSVALNWDISKEHWLSALNNLNELSIYANWGITGNYPLNSLSNSLYAERLLSNEKEYEKAIYISNLANHFLLHEEAEELNFGLRVNVFQDRLLLNANYYMKENRNLIINRDIPYYYGGGKYIGNFGRMRHKGFELTIEGYPVETNKFTWNTIFGYSTNRQRVMDIYHGEDTMLFKRSQILIPDFYIAVDAPIGDIVGYNYQGLWTDEDEELQNPHYINRSGIKYYKNDTLNLELSEDDKMVIGNSLPDFTCHWINNFRYKNFSINMHWYAVIGVDKFNATKASTYYTQVNKEIKNYVDDTLSHFMDPFFYESSYFIEDASFVQLKNLNFVYTPKAFFKNKIQLSFSLSFENLVILSRYSGYDPEATVYTDNNFSDNSIDLGAYPSPKSIFFGIDLTF